MTQVQISSDLQAERKRLDSFFQFGISVDCVVFGYDGQNLQVLLVERGVEPYAGFEAIPGDLVTLHEDITQASKRVLHDLTGLPDIYLEQINTLVLCTATPLGAL